MTKLSRAICVEALGTELDPVQHRRGQPRDRDGLVERARDGAVQEVEVVGACRARVQRRERGGEVARGLAGLRADRGERVRVLLLRHQRARAAVRVGELDEAELLARVDLEVLAELALVGRGDRERREQLEVHVGLPGGVLRVLDERLAAEQLGEPRAVERPARAGAAAGAGDAGAERARASWRGALGVAQRRVGIREEQVADGRRLGRLEVRVVGRERGRACRGRGARAPRPGRRARRAGRGRRCGRSAAGRPGTPRGAGGRR